MNLLILREKENEYRSLFKQIRVKEGFNTE